MNDVKECPKCKTYTFHDQTPQDPDDSDSPMLWRCETCNEAHEHV